VSGPSTAREALIAEALGQLAELTARVEAVLPALDRARCALIEANAALLGRLETLEGRASDLADGVINGAKQRAVEDVARHADAAARQSALRQVQAMNAAAGVLFARELEPRLQRLAASLQRLGERVESPWERWLIHAATVMTSCVVTGAALLYVLRP
jgi:hypothetical protein